LPCSSGTAPPGVVGIEGSTRYTHIGWGGDTAPAAVMKVFEETKRRGVLIGKGGLFGNVIRLGPPLIASKGDIDELVAALDGAFATV